MSLKAVIGWFYVASLSCSTLIFDPNNDAASGQSPCSRNADGAVMCYWRCARQFYPWWHSGPVAEGCQIAPAVTRSRGPIRQSLPTAALRQDHRSGQLYREPIWMTHCEVPKLATTSHFRILQHRDRTGGHVVARRPARERRLLMKSHHNHCDLDRHDQDQQHDTRGKT
jgi:hypothetical protein